MRVNREYSLGEAEAFAEYYGKYVGRLPKILRRHLKYLAFHKGNGRAGAAQGSIHSPGMISWHPPHDFSEYIPDGHLEEIMIHEATHVSIDLHLYGTD